MDIPSENNWQSQSSKVAKPLGAPYGRFPLGLGLVDIFSRIPEWL